MNRFRRNEDHSNGDAFDGHETRNTERRYGLVGEHFDPQPYRVYCPGLFIVALSVTIIYKRSGWTLTSRYASERTGHRTNEEQSTINSRNVTDNATED